MAADKREEDHFGIRRMSGGSLEEKLWLQLALSGFSCWVAQTTVHWIETTMVRQQLSKTGDLSMFGMAAKIVREEGFFSLYRGFAASSLREASYSSLRFGLYEPIKTFLNTLAADPSAPTPFYKKVLAGLSAGAFAAAVASPTDFLKIKAQGETGPSRSIAAHAREIATADGAKTPLAMVGNFYRGVSTTIARAALIGATKMAVYDECKQQLRINFHWRDDVALERYALQFCASISAGLAICLASSPATNARTMIVSVALCKFIFDSWLPPLDDPRVKVLEPPRRHRRDRAEPRPPRPLPRLRRTVSPTTREGSPIHYLAGGRASGPTPSYSSSYGSKFATSSA